MRKGYVFSSISSFVFVFLFFFKNTFFAPFPDLTTRGREVVDGLFESYFQILSGHEARFLIFNFVGTAGGPEVGRRLNLVSYSHSY